MPSGTRQLQKQQTRQTLLAAARGVLARRGFEATTTREIAQEAGVAAGTFFVHFPSVAALVQALLDEHVAATLGRALQAAGKRRGVIAQLTYVCGALFESYDAEPELARAFITGSLFQPAGTPPSARLESFRVWVVARIEDAIASGELPDIDRELAFTSFFAIYFGLLVAGLNGRVPRKRQLALLQAALTRLLLLKAETP